jgi:hypothetical protein
MSVLAITEPRPRHREKDGGSFRVTAQNHRSGKLLRVAVQHFRRHEEHPFTAEERQRVTILFGGLIWKHQIYRGRFSR